MEAQSIQQNNVSNIFHMGGIYLAKDKQKKYIQHSIHELFLSLRKFYATINIPTRQLQGSSDISNELFHKAFIKLNYITIAWLLG